MKIPEGIVGRNKIRDSAICRAWKLLIEDPEFPTKESIKKKLSERFGFTERYIYKIVRRNYAYTPLDRAWEKRKRIERLKIEEKKSGQSKKDIVEILEALRKEIDGDTTVIDVSTHKTYVTVYLPGKADRRQGMAALQTPGDISPE